MKRIAVISSFLVLAGCPAGTPIGSPSPVAPATPVAPAGPLASAPAPVQPQPAKPAVTPAPTARPQELAFPTEEFRAGQPAPGKPRPLQIPEIKTFKMANGIAVYLVQSTKLPVVSLELNFDGGWMNDPAGKEGLASVCMAMMSEGTQELEKVALDDALADIASNVSSYAGRETQGVSMSTLAKNLDATHAIYLQTLFTPGFRQREFDRILKTRLESLQQAKASPESVARRVADRVLYGDTHPFGHLTTEESLKAITIKDCTDYHAAYIKPAGARLFVVGKIDEKTLRAKFGAKALPNWSGKAKKNVKLPKPASMKGSIFFVHVDGAKQSRVSFMHFGPKRKARDYFANINASRILGGGMPSRLSMNLREDKGYSYGAYGGFSYSRDYGELYAASSVRTDATWQSIKEIYKEILELKSGKQAATKAELEREIDGAILSLPSRFATMGQIRGAYRGLVYHRLPLNYYKSYVKKLRKVKLRQVRRSAKKHFKPNKAIIVVVGDGSAAQKQRAGTTDEPLIGKSGQPLTLVESLAELLQSGALGRRASKSQVVHLNADGQVITK